MRDTIDVRENDFMWRFYCKWFSIQKKGVVAPSNLCQYFWLSVYGFGLWLGKEIRLYRIWAFFLAATAIFFGVVPLASYYEGVLISTLCVATSLLWAIAFFVATIVSGLRLVLHERARWVLYLLTAGFALMVLSELAAKGVLLSEFRKLAGEMLQVLKYELALIGFAIAAALLLCKVPSHQTQRVWRLFETFGAYLKARKKAICPSINPPPGFKNPEDVIE